MTYPACAYCGEPASQRDHVIPITYTGRRRPHDPYADEGITVPSCAECNSILGANIFWTWDERVNHLREALAHRHRTILQTPAWTDDEINQLEGTLKRHVRHNETARRILKARLEHEYPEGPEALHRAIEKLETSRWHASGESLRSNATNTPNTTYA